MNTSDNTARAAFPPAVSSRPEGLTTDTLLLSEAREAADRAVCTALVAWNPDAQNQAWEDQAREYIDSSRAENTRKAYASDWRDFATWCADYDHNSLPATPETVVLYLTCRAETHKVSTLQRRLTTISQVHQSAGHESPTQSALVRTAWRGIRRQLGVAPVRKSAAVTTHIRAMLASLPDTIAGTRTRALILIGYAGALRRSELVGLDRRDVEFGPQGVTLTLRRSKTDHEALGIKLGIPYGSDPDTCPVRALSDWLEVSGITKGAIYRGVDRHGNISANRLTPRSVALIVKSAAAAVGLDPAAFGGHSLRAGLITAAATAGVEERDIARQSRHKSTAVLRGYIRDADIWRDNAAGRVGL